MDLLSLSIVVLALVVGALAGYLLAYRRHGRLESRNAVLAAELAHERQAAADKVALLAHAETSLRDAFQSLSAEALKSNNRAFLDLARASLGEFQQQGRADLEQRQLAIETLMKPVHEVLGQLDGNLRQLEKARIEAFTELRTQMASMVQTDQRLQQETANLVRALRAPAVRGRWGEIQLQRVVELAGMIEHCDFEQQPTVMGENGRLRPDLVVRLPGGRNVVVDAKVPIEAYLRALECQDDGEREALLGDHARQVRDHMAKLGQRGYWEQFQPAPEFVVMFLPGESFFSAAAHKDPALIEYGVGQHVLPASPTTLIALLRAVSYGWQQETAARNAQEIGELGKVLYQRLGVMACHFDDVRKGLERTIEAYNAAAGSLERRVLVAARRFTDLGVSTPETIPTLQPVEGVARALAAADDPLGADEF